MPNELLAAPVCNVLTDVQATITAAHEYQRKLNKTGSKSSIWLDRIWVRRVNVVVRD